MRLHAGIGASKFSAPGETDIRNTLLGITTPLSTGTVIASWNRTNPRELVDAAAQQVDVGYTHKLSKLTELCSSASWTRNNAQIALNTYANGASQHGFRAGTCDSF